MRLLKDLFETGERVWIYCESEELQDQFLKQAEEEGFLALNGQKPTELIRQRLYGLNDDMTMGYLSIMIWCITFEKCPDKYFRVDYGRYILNEDDYICHTSHFQKMN